MNSSIYSNDALGEGARSARKLVPINAKLNLDRVMDATAVVPPTPNFGALQTQIEQVSATTAVPMTTLLRRLLFIWLRIYVYENKRGKEQRVNVSIPLPIPVLGATFRNKLTWNQALKAVSLAQADGNGPTAVGRYLESCMALELIRVEEESMERAKKQLVVIGLD